MSHIKMQVPLPETADELCAVALGVQAHPRDVRLGAQATEREIKRLSVSGELAKYRMVHFATHGALAGELDRSHEPGPSNTNRFAMLKMFAVSTWRTD